MARRFTVLALIAVALSVAVLAYWLWDTDTEFKAFRLPNPSGVYILRADDDPTGLYYLQRPGSLYPYTGSPYVTSSRVPLKPFLGKRVRLRGHYIDATSLLTLTGVDQWGKDTIAAVAIDDIQIADKP
ncbi:hypothetical protein AB0L75_37740 [Streptomyces sp. NPDC052101]|uniref:hypothetical protein n=1 Tax=Streptomyces sp. NPDC052101 TaxID=3155763 RepID=UPI003449EF0B